MTDPDPASRSDPPRRRSWFGFFSRRRSEPEPVSAMAEEAAAVADELVIQARAFEDVRVEDVMKPRADIVAIERACSFSELVARFVEAEHSRMPVYQETLDEPVGVVHVKDVFKLLAQKTRRPRPDDRVLQGRRGLVREALYVPGSMPAADLLARMRAKHIHMALVIDEFGGTDGLVTLEDLLEMLVGDISDEHDLAEDEVAAPVAEAEGVWVVDGRAPLEELEAALGGVDLAPADVDEEIDTVAGLVNTLAGRVPQRRETIAHPGGFLIEVLAADPRRVKRVRIRRAKPPSTTV
ncbi:hemolysin family protein [Phenylobacterium sp.]|uniref:hemolysin family protein n=1 Tax=Phenylobacterium sp. TaxID=1871053 RepID=UPI0039C91EB3